MPRTIDPTIDPIDTSNDRKTRTVSVRSDDRRVAHQVQSLRVLPTGPVFQLDSFRKSGDIQRRLVVGAGSHCDITIDDDKASATHCLVARHTDRLLVTDCDSHNGTFINGTWIQSAVLAVGSLLTIGETTVLAVGEQGEAQEITYSATSLYEFVVNSTRLYGSLRRAASAIGLPESTLRDWLEDERYKKTTRQS